MTRRRIQLNAVQTLTLGFACLILLGGLLLALPAASRGGRPLPFLDALFTAASASCVTGLVLYDTFTQFSLFGQAVILLLIQVGGLGFMTVSILVSILLGRRIGLHQRSILMDTVGALQMGGVVRLTRRALKVTAACEGTGAVLLALWFCPRYGMGRGIWMAVFHAVSAYCNAGFDLLGTGASLTTEAGEPLLNIVLMVLIICGGLGFLVWDDILTHGFRVRRWRLHSKIVAFSTSLLFVGGAAAFYLLEKDHAFAGLPTGQKLLMSAFQSVTPRTAGFNTVDLAALSESGTLLTLILMFIGAGSGSTGGGIKVFRILILCKTIRKELHIFLHPNAVKKIKMDGKVIPHEVLRSTNIFIIVYILIIAGSIFLIAFDDFDLITNFTAVTATFNNIGPGLELVGPIGNFGMFSWFSKIVLTFDMLAGRLEIFPLLLLFVRDTWKKF